MSDDRRIVMLAVITVAAVTTNEAVLTAAVSLVAYVLLRFFHPRRDTWDATAAHRRRMAAIRRHPARGGRR